MNVVIFGKGFGQPLQINLSGRSAGALAVLIVGVLGSVMFGAGYWYSAQTGSGISQTEVSILSQEVVAQQESIAETSKPRIPWTL